jgi:hypothetical protein
MTVPLLPRCRRVGNKPRAIVLHKSQLAISGTLRGDVACLSKPQ